MFSIYYLLLNCFFLASPNETITYHTPQKRDIEEERQVHRERTEEEEEDRNEQRRKKLATEV